MNKAEFISFMAETNKQSKVDSERALNFVTESLIGALSKGQEVNLIGFGSFKVQKREARGGRNPKTGKKMRISAYKQPVFKSGKKLKECCN